MGRHYDHAVKRIGPDGLQINWPPVLAAGAGLLGALVFGDVVWAATGCFVALVFLLALPLGNRARLRDAMKLDAMELDR
jgi:hypothetical protein